MQRVCRRMKCIYLLVMSHAKTAGLASPLMPASKIPPHPQMPLSVKALNSEHMSSGKLTVKTRAVITNLDDTFRRIERRVAKTATLHAT